MITEHEIARIKIEAVNEIRDMHNEARSKINSQCDTLINTSTLDDYESNLEDLARTIV